MTPTPVARDLPNTKPIYRLIRQTRRRLRTSWVATGLGISLGLLLATLVIVTMLDLAMPLWPIFRLLALLLVLVPATWAFGVGVVLPLCRRLRAGYVARRIEAHLPGIHNRLVSCLDLATGKQPTYSPAFYRRLVHEALERIREFRPGAVVDYLSLRRAGGFAGVSCIAFIILWAGFSDRLPTALARIFAPFADIPPASGVVYTVTPGDAKVLRGEDIPFRAHVEKGEPDDLRLELRGQGGERLRYDLQKQTDGTWAFTLGSANIAAGFDRSFHYRVRGGGTWSKEYTITVLDRPSIVNLHTVLHYPDYMGIAEPYVGPDQIADVTGPETSAVEVVVETEGDVAVGEIQLLEREGHQHEKVLVPMKSLPMQPVSDHTWTGRFPLVGEGYYRVELRNELGHANKTMKEGKYVAVPDNPPQVVLERPGIDLTVGELGKVPLVIAAYDDFGLADLNLLIQRDGQSGITGQLLKRYHRPERSDTVLSAFDLAPLKLKPGEQVRYRIEARDRKGQLAQTREFTIRFSGDKNGAEQQLANFERTEDNFREKLIKLIAQQAKVRERVEKLNAKYEPINDKLRAFRTAQQIRETTPSGQNLSTKDRPPELDPESAKQLAELRKELGELAGQEQQNTQFSQQIEGDLKNAAEQAAQLPLMPPEVIDQLRALQQRFGQQAVTPLRDLSTRMEAARNPQKEAPDMPRMKGDADRIQKELEAMKERLQALAKAQKQLRQNADDALARLRQEMLRQDAGLSARDLAALHEYMEALRKELTRLEGSQEKLMEANEAATDRDRPKVERDQDRLEKEADKPLAQTRELQDRDPLRKMRRRPRFPQAPYTPETEDEMVPPKEEEPDEPDAPKARSKEEGKAAKPERGKDEEEPLYMPALGGPRPKLDPRFADKRRPVQQRAKGDAERRRPQDREALGQRQAQKYQELDEARQSLGSDEQALDSIMQRLQEALQGDQGHSKPSREARGEPGTSSPQLSQLLQSPTVQEALAMAARLRQLANSQSGQGSQVAPSMSQSPLGNLQGTPRFGMPGVADLSKLDLATRDLLMKMQPKLREELLQGMHEEGPEGYRQFIQDYFRRLSQEKNAK
jgi:hypothetical protein